MCRKVLYMQENKELTTEEKARLMHNYYQREWYRKNKDKAKKARTESLAKKYDEMIAERGGTDD